MKNGTPVTVEKEDCTERTERISATIVSGKFDIILDVKKINTADIIEE